MHYGNVFSSYAAATCAPFGAFYSDKLPSVSSVGDAIARVGDAIGRREWTEIECGTGLTVVHEADSF